MLHLPDCRFVDLQYGDTLAEREAVETATSVHIEHIDDIDNIPAPSTGRPSPHVFFPWRRIRERAGLAGVRLHDLRHSFASFLVNEGVSLYRVQRLLGHEHSRSTARYSHLSPETLHETAEMLTSLLPLKKGRTDAV